MFIKIDKERVINTDQLIAILPAGEIRLFAIDQDTQLANELALSEDEVILVMTREYIHTTSAIAAYISQMVDAADGFTETTDKPQELSLHSRIAVLLKNRKEGLTAKEIKKELNLGTDTFSDEMLAVCLNELNANNVIVTELNLDSETRYYHAANTTTDVDF